MAAAVDALLAAAAIRFVIGGGGFVNGGSNQIRWRQQQSDSLLVAVDSLMVAAAIRFVIGGGGGCVGGSSADIGGGFSGGSGGNQILWKRNLLRS